MIYYKTKKGLENISYNGYKDNLHEDIFLVYFLVSGYVFIFSTILKIIN